MTSFYNIDSANARIPEVREILLRLREQREELLRLNKGDLLAEPQRREGKKSGGQASLTGRTRDRHKTKDGRVFPAEVTRAALTISGRAMIMALTRDLSEHEKAEEAERLRQDKKTTYFVQPFKEEITQ